jgi:hypothetical protein
MFLNLESIQLIQLIDQNINRIRELKFVWWICADLMLSTPW